MICQCRGDGGAHAVAVHVHATGEMTKITRINVRDRSDKKREVSADWVSLDRIVVMATKSDLVSIPSIVVVKGWVGLAL